MTRTVSAPLNVTTADVVVVGGGNAGLCAALRIRELADVRVLVLETAPKPFRGGNSRHTRNLRCMHDAPTALLDGTYGEREYFEDIVRVTGGCTDEQLAHLVVQESKDCSAWMQRFGVRFQRPLKGTLHLNRTNAFFLGGGKALLNSYYAAADHRQIDVVYDADVVALDIVDNVFRAVETRIGDRLVTITAKAVVLACGGFEANLEWLKESWGNAADNFIVRGTPFNRGTVLRHMLHQGAMPIGDAKKCHAVAVDARAPRFDGGIVTRLDSISLGIVVNRDGRRFYDEGEDFWPKRYAIWGGLIAEQEGQFACSIVDAKAIGHFMPTMFPPKAAASIRELAAMLGLRAGTLEATVAEYNAAVQPGAFDHSVLDDCRTTGLTPNKSHWARRIDDPPFLGYPMRPGITFTYLGLRVDEHARVQMTDGRPATNMFAAGEIMAGNILTEGYVAGLGMTIGTVFGRIAGAGAANYVHRRSR